jgi:YjbE family integral membrane protein
MDYLTILFSIIVVNLLLSGDNALVIALASRRLPPRQQKAAVLWGGAGAVGLRVVLTIGAVWLLTVPYLQLAGGLLLLWVAIQLAADSHHTQDDIKPAQSLGGAVKTILVADLVMSLDNVVAIAGVSRGNVAMLVVGLAISIPIIIWGSKLIGLLMERWPLAIIAGAAFLGWTGGEMAVADRASLPTMVAYPMLEWLIPGVFAAVVVLMDYMKRHGDVKDSA